jgi:hypothetical protein
LAGSLVGAVFEALLEFGEFVAQDDLYALFVDVVV